MAASPAPIISPMACPMKQVSQNAPWGGGCPWQYDKSAFKQFVRAAIDVPSSKERKELYGYLSECFMDADQDRDGLVGADEFDFLIEKSAAIPRRFGMAPSWPEMYGDDAHRREERKKLFASMDKHRRQAIGMEEWMEFAMQHIAGKVRTMKLNTTDFAHLARTNADEFVRHCEVAVSNSHSEEYKSLYEHLFKVFVESDVEEKGKVHRENFDRLIEDAAEAPRAVGLAPSTAQAYPTEQHKRAARDAEFAAMDFENCGEIHFDCFLKWALQHIAEKVQQYRAGERYQPPAAVPTVMAAAPVTMACPVSGAVSGACPIVTR